MQYVWSVSEYGVNVVVSGQFVASSNLNTLDILRALHSCDIGDAVFGAFLSQPRDMYEAPAAAIHGYVHRFFWTHADVYR